jgi:hypothetical protein
VFPECKVCGHPWLSHAEGECFCGCTGRSADQEPRGFPTGAQRTTDTAPGTDGWTPDEDALLERRYLDGELISRLSTIHERKPSAIITRLEQLGLVEPRRRAD